MVILTVDDWERAVAESIQKAGPYDLERPSFDFAYLEQDDEFCRVPLTFKQRRWLHDRGIPFTYATEPTANGDLADLQEL